MSEGDKARAEARIGRVLNDKWTLERLLGLGGMAAVYAGLHRNGARAAVKVLHPELSHDGDIRERFLREGYVANQVAHPGAVQVLDDDVVTGGPDDGTAYLVMELLEGEPVDERVFRSGKPLPEDAVLAVADDVLAVLEAAHAKQIVHRDIKPENLFLTKGADGELHVKVLDFGFARIARGMNTRMGVALGTPSFMSPEQAAGRGDEIDGRSDIFGVGATMYRLLTNARIHEGSNGPDIAGKMATLPAPSILTIAPHLSTTIASIVDRSLQFRKEDRYPDAASMRAEVQAARKTMAAAAARLERQSTILDRSGAISPSPPPSQSSPQSSPVSLDPSLLPPLIAGPSPISTPARRAPPAQLPPRRVVEPPPDAPARSQMLREPKEKRSSASALIAFGWVLLVAAIGTVVFIVRGRLIGAHQETALGDDGGLTQSDGAPEDAAASGDEIGDNDLSAVTPIASATGSDGAGASTVEGAPDASDVESLDDDDDDDDAAPQTLDGSIEAGASSSGTAQKQQWNSKTPIKKKPIGNKKKKKWK